MCADYYGEAEVSGKPSAGAACRMKMGERRAYARVIWAWRSMRVNKAGVAVGVWALSWRRPA